METTLLGLALPKVLKKLKEMLVYQGFIVQTMPTANPVLIANKKGNWLNKPRQFIIEITSENNNTTRINITAIIKNMKNNHHAEEILEVNFSSKLYTVFNKIIQRPYGI